MAGGPAWQSGRSSFAARAGPSGIVRVRKDRHRLEGMWPLWQRELVRIGHVRQAYGDGIGNGSVTGLFVTVSDFCSGSSGPSGEETDIDHESDQVP